MSAADGEPDRPDEQESGPAPLVFDRHLVLDQLGGWRGMIDASLPTVAFIVGTSFGGLWVGIWTALAAAVVVFAVRLVRRQSLQQGLSGLIGVGVAVAIAAASGEARDFFAGTLARAQERNVCQSSSRWKNSRGNRLKRFDPW